MERSLASSGGHLGVATEGLGAVMERSLATLRGATEERGAAVVQGPAGLCTGPGPVMRHALVAAMNGAPCTTTASTTTCLPAIGWILPKSVLLQPPVANNDKLHVLLSLWRAPG